MMLSSFSVLNYKHTWYWSLYNISFLLKIFIYIIFFYKKSENEAFQITGKQTIKHFQCRMWLSSVLFI